MRMLERGKVPFKVQEYKYDVNDLSGEHMALLNGLNEDKVFKTIVLKGDKNGFLVAVVNTKDSIDLKKIAKISGNKSAELVPIPSLEHLTGYIRGGCSPIGMKKKFPTYASSKLLIQNEIYVSAGKRGLQLIMKAADLVSFCQIEVGDITQG